MEHENDKNYVAVGFGMLAMLVTAIPCIGWIMVLGIGWRKRVSQNYF